MWNQPRTYIRPSVKAHSAKNNHSRSRIRKSHRCLSTLILSRTSATSAKTLTPNSQLSDSISLVYATCVLAKQSILKKLQWSIKSRNLSSIPMLISQPEVALRKMNDKRINHRFPWAHYIRMTITFLIVHDVQNCSYYSSPTFSPAACCKKVSIRTE